MVAYESVGFVFIMFDYIGNRGDRGVERRDEHLHQVILPRIFCCQRFVVGRAWRVYIGWSCGSTMVGTDLDTQWRSKWVSVGAATQALERLVSFQEIVKLKSKGLRVCLWGIFQSGGSEDVMQLLEDWWHGSRRGCAAQSSPGVAEPRRMTLHQLASMVCKDE